MSRTPLTALAAFVALTGLASFGQARDPAPDPQQPGASTLLFGLPHTPLGGGALTILGTGFDVGGIGTSGADGFAVQTGPVRGVALGLDGIPVAAPAGAARRLDWNLVGGGRHRLVEQKAPFGVVLGMDFGGGPGQLHTIELLIDGAVVASQTDAEADDVVVVFGPDGIGIIGGGTIGPLPATGPVATYDRTWSTLAPRLAILPNGQTALVDGVRFSLAGTADLGPVQSLALYASGTGAFAVTGEAIGLGGARVSAFGAVSLTPQPAGLAVLRSPGSLNEGGARVERSGSSGTGKTLGSVVVAADLGLPIPPSQAPPLAFVDLRLAESEAPAAAATLRCQGDGSGLTIESAFDPASPGTTLLELLAAGTTTTIPVGSLDVQLATTGWPDSVKTVSSAAKRTFELGWDDVGGVPLDIPGLGVVVADGVRISRVHQASVPVLDRLDVVVNRLPGFVLADLNLTVSEAAPPHPGTGEDLALYTTDPTLGAPTAAPLKSLPALAPVALLVRSLHGDFDLRPLVIVVQLLLPGEASLSPFPGIAVNPAGITGVLVGTAAAPFGPVLLAPGGTTVTIVPPTALVGIGLLIQAIVPSPVAANGIFGATDGHRSTIVP